MSFSQILFFIIFTWVTSIDRSQCDSTPPAPIIGPSSCFVKGKLDSESCTIETVICDKLPDDCTSYVWSSVYITVNSSTVYDFYGTKHDEYFKQLLKCTQKPVIVRYGYYDMEDWGTVFNCSGTVEEQVLKEINGLNKYLESHPHIAGLMLANLEVVPTVPIYANFSQKLTSYIQAYKKHMKTPMQIGAYLYADSMMDYYKNPTPEWIDFQTVPFDFILIAFNYLNVNCTADFKTIGLTPITGNVGRTVEQFEGILDKIPATKRFLKFDIHPVDKDGSNYCVVSNALMCLNPKKAAEWCSDTIASYHAKGKYSSSKAAGFVAAPVNMDDPDNLCGCGQYPAFNAVLAGFNKKEVPPSCKGIDRN